MLNNWRIYAPVIRLNCTSSPRAPLKLLVEAMDKPKKTGRPRGSKYSPKKNKKAYKKRRKYPSSRELG